MASRPDESLRKVAKDISQPRLSKNRLAKSLIVAENALLDLSQSATLKSAIRPLINSLVENDLLHHKDKEVRLLVAACFTEIIRVLAPHPPFSDEIFKDVFRLIISTFVDLGDTTNAYFTRRSRILETVSRLKCCVIMLDIGGEDLVLEMFRVFFSTVQPTHQDSVLDAMLSIMTVILQENVSQPLLDEILRNLLKEEKCPSSQLAVSVIQHCTGNLEPSIRSFLISCMSEKDGPENELKKSYHDIILKIYQCAPEILFAVIPNLTQELLTDQVDVRLEAVHLVGKLLAASKFSICQDYRSIFVEFLKRFSDKSTEVRLATIECAKACYMAVSSRSERDDILTAFEGRLLDFDDTVRIEAVLAVCALAKSNLACFPTKLVSEAMKRLRDKKASVRKRAMHGLLDLYRVFCDKCSEGVDIPDDCGLYEQIPCRILVLCFDKDCKEFRPQNMELVLAENLFPASLCVKERTRHWVEFFSLCTSHHIKALDSILSQKQRLQMEMQAYLAIRETEKENCSEEVKKRIVASFSKMSTSFVDSSEANSFFHELHQMKDKRIFKALLELVEEYKTLAAAISIRDSFLKRIGTDHPNYRYFKILSSKCSYSIFTEEHVRNIFVILEDSLSKNRSENKYVESSIDLLLAIITRFPPLLRGSEECLMKLLLEKTVFSTEKLLQILARAGRHVAIKLCDVYSFLEKMCLEGTRAESKYAVAAIASLLDASDELTFTNLCKKLVISLHEGRNIPSLLQSLGCISQYSISTYEMFGEKIMQFIVPKEVHSSHEQASSNCKLKIYGMKALVKCFLAHSRPEVKEFLNILLNIIQGEGITDAVISSEVEKYHIRLAAAKSILRLATRWDMHISPKIFRFTILMARDNSSVVRKLFLFKVHKLLKDQAIPNRYACAFALSSTDDLEDVRCESRRYLMDFIKEYGKDACINPNPSAQNPDGDTMTKHPAYIVVFLIHVLVHHEGFPSEHCQDENAYAEFCSPLIVILRALVDVDTADSKNRSVSNTVSYLLGIFRAIKKAEDAVDSQLTPKLHTISEVGLLTVKVLSRRCKSLSNSPCRVLLPSSYYQVCSDTRDREVHNHHAKFLDEDFVKRIVEIVEPNPFEISGPNSRQSGRSEENNRQPDDIKNNTKNVHLERKGNSLTSQSKGKKNNVRTHGKGLHKAEPKKVSDEAKHRGMLSDFSSKSRDLLLEKLPANKRTQVKPSSSNSYLGKEQLSSCGSASTNTSLADSPILLSEAALDGYLPQPTIKKTGNSRFGIEQPEIRENISQSLDSKDPGDRGEVLVGQQDKLLSPLNMCGTSGTVESYDSQDSSDKVTCDNGRVEFLCLEDGMRDTIDGTPSWHKVDDFRPKECSSSRNSEKVVSDITDHANQRDESSALWLSSSSMHEDVVNVLGDSDSQKDFAILDEDNGTLHDRSHFPVGGATQKRKRQMPSASTKKSPKTNVGDVSTGIVTRSRSTRAQRS